MRGRKRGLTELLFSIFCALLWFEVSFEVIGLPVSWKEILYIVVNATTFPRKL